MNATDAPRGPIISESTTPTQVGASDLLTVPFAGAPIFTRSRALRPTARCCPSTRAATTAPWCCRPSTGGRTEPGRSRPRDRAHPGHDLRPRRRAHRRGPRHRARPARRRPPRQARHAPRHQPLGASRSSASTSATTRSSAARSSTSTAASSPAPRSHVDGATGEAAAAKVDRARRPSSLGAATLPVLGIGVGSPGVVDLGGTVQSAAQPRLERRAPAGARSPPRPAARARRERRQRRGARRAQLRRRAQRHDAHQGRPRCRRRPPARRHPAVRQPLRRRRDRPRRRRHRRRRRAARAARTAASRPGSPSRGSPRSSQARRRRRGPSRSRRDPASSRAQRLGIALAPVVGALNLGEVVLSGPAELLDGPLARGRRRDAPQADDGRVQRRSEVPDDRARPRTSSCAARPSWSCPDNSGSHSLTRTSGRVPSERSGAPHPTQEKETAMKRKYRLSRLATAAALVLAGCQRDRRSPPTTDPQMARTSRSGSWAVTPRTRCATTSRPSTPTPPGAPSLSRSRAGATLCRKLTTALPDAENTPDVTEIGNTWSPTFTNVGRLHRPRPTCTTELGGDKLLQSFVEVGEVDGANYALPYYFGSRYNFYRKDIWAAAGKEVPTTLGEFGDTVKALTTDAQSGFYIGGSDWRNGISWIFANGGELASEGRRPVGLRPSPTRIDQGSRAAPGPLHERLARPGHRVRQHPVGQHQQQRRHGQARGRDDHRSRMGALVDR